MAGPGRKLGLFLPAQKISAGPGRNRGIFLPAQKFSAGPGGSMRGVVAKAMKYLVYLLYEIDYRKWCYEVGLDFDLQ